MSTILTTTPESETTSSQTSSTSSQDESVLIDLKHVKNSINVEFECLNFFGEKCKGISNF